MLFFALVPVSHALLLSPAGTLLPLSLPSWPTTIPSPDVDHPGGPDAVVIAGGAIVVEPTEVADAEVTAGNPPTAPSSVSLGFIT